MSLLAEIGPTDVGSEIVSSAPLPSHERERVEALRRFEILDTPAEPEFDDIVRLAAIVCRTPTAFIALIDEGRQWFKARHGFDVPETPRDVAFCAHTIMGTDVVVVPDATCDPRFATNPSVAGEPHIRFYAGAPLVTEDGHALGSLAVIDYVPRSLDDAQREGLRALTRQVMAQLELRRRRRGDARRSPEGTDRALVESELQKTALLESALDCIVEMDHLGRVVEWNPAAERVFGFSRMEVLGRDMASLIIPETFRERHRRGLADYLVTGHGVILNRRLEMTAQRADGTEFPVELTISRLTRGEPPVFVGFIRDVTESQLAQEQLRQSQKMEAIGQLSGGVAHDFNNILTVVQGNASLLSALVEHEEAPELVQEIVLAVERGASLTRQLLMFSRKQVLHPTDISLSEVARNMTRMLERLLGADIILRSDLPSNLPLVRADSGMMEQVLLNLAVNARDAMPDGGQLVIATSAKKVEARRVKENPERTPGLRVSLTVSDTGTGIPPDVLARIYEPFFTTKPAGKGTGLGLSTVYGIVKQHNGWIEVATILGRGTSFEIFLPALEELSSESAQPAAPVAAQRPRGTETILVVEDEDAVRQLAVNLLSRCGYTVLQAASGVAALEVWKANRDRVHLLLTDLVMPHGINGRELATRLRADKPELKVIFCSGYSADIVQVKGELTEGVNFLQKPYHPDRLAQVVRQRLDSDAEPAVQGA
jgi:two-component system cell cycle sensor histidine kinase/response regulator CckA